MLDEDSDEDEEEENGPQLDSVMIQHHGAVNRTRVSQRSGEWAWEGKWEEREWVVKKIILNFG